jgi:hypothetical protein
VKLLSNKPANLLTKYEIQQIQNQGMTDQTPNNEKPKQPSFHVHACADYANENLLVLYTHVHAVHMLPSFHVPMHVLKKVEEGKRHTRRRKREREYALPGCWLFWFITWIQLLNISYLSI